MQTTCQLRKRNILLYQKPPNQQLLVSGIKHGFVVLQPHVTGNKVTS
jgi:hypothetical protein